MKTENINNSLANIQDSLKEMESAREQVEKVTNSGHNLTLSTNKFINEVKEFTANIQSELLTTISVFTEHLNKTSEGMNSRLDLNNSHIADKMEASDKYLKEKNNDINKNIQENINRFRDDVNRLRDESKEIIIEIAINSKRNLESQNEAILSTIESISKYVLTVQSLIDVIDEANISSKLDDLKKSNKNFNDKIALDKSELHQVIENKIEYLKENIEKSISEISRELKITRIVVILFGSVIIIQSCLIIYKLIK